MGTLWKIALLSMALVGTETRAQKISPATTQKEGLKAGLKGEYFAGPNFERKVLTRTDAQVAFNWNWEMPGPGVPREYFSVRWTGKLYAPTTGKYRFSATVDDGVRVWVNGRKVIDEWRKQDDSQFVGEIALNGKRYYDLRIEYYNDWKGSVISVFWESPEDRRMVSSNAPLQKVIPARYLFSKPVTLPPPAVAAIKPIPRKSVPLAASQPNTKTMLPKSTAAQPEKSRPTSIVRTPVPVQQSEPTQAAIVPSVGVAAPTNDLFTKLRRGEAVVLPHVIFTQSEYTLLPESYAELDRLVQVLRTDTAFRITIAGHTDNVGDKQRNQTLSEYRARVVANYLVTRGISDARITAKGYGGSRPIVDNTSEAKRAQNRRVEFTLTD